MMKSTKITPFRFCPPASGVWFSRSLTDRARHDHLSTTLISRSTLMPTIPIPVPAPVPASVLVDRELARRKNLRGNQQKGNILTGCREIDEYVLLGGFERGSVVGVSAEDDEMGLLIGLQTVAHLLVTAKLEIEMLRDWNGDGGKTTGFSFPCPSPRVTIVTMLPVNVLVPKLRQILVNQLAAGLSSAAGGGALQNINALVKRCLGNISISMVFDVEGLREVLGEIGGSLSSALSPHDTVEGQEQQHQQRHIQLGQQQEKEEERLPPQDGPTSKEEPVEAETEAVQNEPVVSIPMPIPIRSPAKPQPVKSRFKTEILDSEDEGEEEDGVEVEDLGNATDSSSELSSPPASLPDEFEEYEKLLQDTTPAPKRDEDILETTREKSIDKNENLREPPADNMESQLENSDNTNQTQPPPENKDGEPSLGTEAQPPPPPLEENSEPPANIDVQPPPPPPPDMILITHMSALLNGLFTGRDKPTAHETMTLLSSQLRQLTGRSDNYPSPLIMILNSTTTSASSASVAMTSEDNPNSNNMGEQRPASREQQRQQHQQQATTNPTLRSIFQHHHQGGIKTKPSFGTVFAQLLDLHLLCTRIPRGQRQTGPARGGMGRGRGEPPLSTARTGAGVGGISSPLHKFAWVVEVLLDERGVYEFDGDDDDNAGVDGGITGEERGYPPETQRQIRRRCREQRWGAVEVEEGGGRIVDVVI